MRFIDRRILAVSALTVVIAASSHAAPTQGACSVLSKADVKPFTGAGSVFDAMMPEEEQIGRGSACNYADIYVQIDPFPFSNVDAERTKPGQKFEAIPGVGDVAYARENTRSGDAEIFLRVGQRVASIQMGINPGSTYASVKPRLVGLAKVLAPKLK